MKKVALTIAALTAAMFPPAVMQAKAEGFFEDTKASITFRNFYFNQDNREHQKYNSQTEEWGQAFFLNVISGYTPGVIGFGVDLHGMLGVRLDGGGRIGKDNLDRTPSVIFPTDNGRMAHEFSSLGVIAKARYAKTVAQYGKGFEPQMPILSRNFGRLLPHSFSGGMIASNDFDNLKLVGGVFSGERSRGSTNYQPMTIAGTGKANSKHNRGSNKFYFAGADYKATDNLLLQYYYGNLKDFYKQHFLGLVHDLPLGPGKLNTDLRFFYSTDDGKNSSASGRDSGYTSEGYYGGGRTKGKVDNRTLSGLFTYSVYGHSFGLGLQQLYGNSNMPFISSGNYDPGDGGSTVYLFTQQLIGNFTRVGERSMMGKYDYDFGQIGVPGLKFSIDYVKGTQIRTARGDKKEWERDFTLAYTIQEGALKGLGVTYQNGSMRSQVADDMEQHRLFLTYTLPLF